MVSAPLDRKLQSLLQRFPHSPYFPAIVGVLGLFLTMTMSFPYGLLLATAVILAPKRKRAVWICAAIGAACGAWILVYLFYRFGWTTLLHYKPEILSSPTWMTTSDWIDKYGLWALFLACVGPLPITPALALFSLREPDWLTLILVLLAAKFIKYGFLVWTTGKFRFPLRWRRMLRIGKAPATEKSRSGTSP